MSEWQPFKITDFTQGYIDKIDDTELPANALRDCRNVVSRQIGKLSSRRGQKKLNSAEIGSGVGIQGLNSFYCGSIKYLVVAVNGTVYCCTPPSGTMTQIKAGLDAAAPIMFVTAIVDGKNQIMGFNGVDNPFKWDGTVGQAQTETATVVGTITTAGNVTVTITAAGMTGSPNANSVVVALNDNAAAVAGKVRTALSANADVIALFDVGGTEADVVLTRKINAANDSTLNIAIANDTCAGLTDTPTSANTAAGIAPGVSDLQDYRIVTREEPTTSDYTVYALEHKPVRTGSDKFFVFANNDLVDTAGYTLDDANGTVTFASARVNTVSDRTSDDAQTVTYPYNGRIESLHPYKTGCTVTVYDKDGNVLKALTDETEVDGWMAIYSDGVVYSPSSVDLSSLMPISTTYQWTDVIKVDYQYSNGDASSQFRYPRIHRGRVFVMAGDERIYWSDITENGSEYESWPPVNHWPVKQGVGDSDGCLISMMGELFIFQNRSIHRFRGLDLEDFRMDEVEPDIGCAGPRAACLDGSKIYFVSEQGLYVFNGMEAVNISRERIPGLWSRVNQTYLHNAAVHAWHGLVLFSLPMDSSTVNNLVIAHDPNTGAMWPWDGMNLTCWAEINTTSGTKLYAGHASTGFILEQDTGTDDAGVNISSYIELPTIDVGEADKMKKARYVYVEYGQDHETFGVCKVAKDYEDYVQLVARNVDKAMRKYALRPTIQGKWRYLSVRIEYSQAGSFEVRSVLVPYKLKNKSHVKGAVT